MRAILIGMAIANILVVLPNLILVWVHCKPASAVLDPLRQGQCDFEPVLKYWYLQGGKYCPCCELSVHHKSVLANVEFLILAIWSLTDLIQTAIALAIIWPLNISRVSKVFLSCLMSLGILAFAITIVRTVFDRAFNSPDLSCRYTFCVLAQCIIVGNADSSNPKTIR